MKIYFCLWDLWLFHNVDTDIISLFSVLKLLILFFLFVLVELEIFGSGTGMAFGFVFGANWFNILQFNMGGWGCY